MVWAWPHWTQQALPLSFETGAQAFDGGGQGADSVGTTVLAVFILQVFLDHLLWAKPHSQHEGVKKAGRFLLSWDKPSICNGLI